ncbi:MAG: DNA primase [Candidatus Moranbacteria bacterium]|nr:DNA primase [Candidatus Moranbacteria bacterium]
MSDVEEIKSRLNIVDVVANYLRLTASGSNHKALCPFHNEKTPSFMVNEDRQIFHCFGCGKGGDMITFIQEIERLSFFEALKLLADRAGVDLKQSQGSGQEREKKSELIKIMAESVIYYRKQLRKPEASRARDYLKKRGVNQELADRFELGYARDEWEGLKKHLLEIGFKQKQIEQTGLLSRSVNNPDSYYDRFRNRIMFPIANAFGAWVGFSARILPGDETPMGKYINTPQTVLYDKSRAIYGIQLAKEAIKKQDFSIVVEGNLDVILSFKTGVENAIAMCGTSVTQEQLKMLKRYSNKIVFAFDADQAGAEAAEKAIDLSLNLGMEVGVIEIDKIKAGTDVAEVVVNQPKKWQQAIRDYTSALDYYFNYFLKDFEDLNIAEKKQRIEAVLAKITQINSKIEQDYYIEELAHRTKAKSSTLFERIQAENINRTNQTTSEPTKDSTDKNELTSLEKLINRILVLIVLYPEKYFEKRSNPELDNYLKNKQRLRPSEQILKIILAKAIVFKKPISYLNMIEQESLKTHLARLITVGEKYYQEQEEVLDFDAKAELDFYLTRFKQIIKKQNQADLLADIKEAEQAKDKKLVAKLVRQYNELIKN